MRPFTSITNSVVAIILRVEITINSRHRSFSSLQVRKKYKGGDEVNILRALSMGDFGLILKHKSLIQLHTEAVAGGEKEDGRKR